jgi:hypothetical protein
METLSDVYMGSTLFRIFDNKTHWSQVTLPSFSHVKHIQGHLKVVDDSLFRNVLVVADENVAQLILQEVRKSYFPIH